VFGGKTEIPNPAYEETLREEAANRVTKGLSRNPEEADWYYRTQPAGQRLMKQLHPELFDNTTAQPKTIDVRKTPQYQDAFRKTKLSRLRGTISGPGSTTGKSTASAADEIKRVAKLGRPMPVKNVPAAAKGLGITEEEFSRLWHSAGGHITP
jgi:hypothetical protein